MLGATSYGIIISNSFFKHYLLTTSLKFLEYFPCLYVYIFFHFNIIFHKITELQ